MNIKDKYTPKNIDDCIFNKKYILKLYDFLKHPNHNNLMTSDADCSQNSCELPVCSLMDLLAGVISIAPSLSFAKSGTSALPGVLAFSGSEPVLRLIDVTVNHELSAVLILIPVVSVHGFFVWEHFSEMVWVSLLDGFGTIDHSGHGY